MEKINNNNDLTAVIFGNMMVIAAVRITKKLRGATNLFIVSLAWADLMLGMVVLPFSAMYEGRMLSQL